MIGRQEIMELSREFSLRPNVVEKDYALGWLLFGIGQHPELKDKWIFKGGTCLKKCYFETYRFSEDLDFTLQDPAHLDEPFLIRVFREVGERVYERSGLELHPETFRFEVFQNPRGKTAVQGRVGYRGPIAPGGELPRIKLDLTNDEQVVLRPIRRPVHHGYSDAPQEDIEVLCYPFVEIFAEKMRALAERERPRDLYDVIHLYRHTEMRPDREAVHRVLEEKCRFKGISFPTLRSLEQKEPQRTELQTEWANMLAHQLPALPPFEEFWNELSHVFDWLAGAAIPVLERIQPEPGRELEDTQWTPPPVAQAWGMRVPLEVIRFAGSNHLCVNLGYDGTKRVIEPYSLRRTQAGNILLHAIRVDSRKHRSYDVDKIESAEVLQKSFTPVYTVELAPGGPIHAPLQTRSSTASPFGKGFSTRRSMGGVAGPKYVVQCSLCGKRFTKTTMDTSLRPHKSKGGYPCSGSYGQYVETKWG